jgi:sugar phosphate permease
MDQAVANETISYSWFGLALGSPTIAWLSDKWRSRKQPMALFCLAQLAVIVVILSAPDFICRWTRNFHTLPTHSSS